MRMKDTLKPGIESAFSFRIPGSKVMPALDLESAEFQEPPKVFATGFLVGFLEWACIEAPWSKLQGIFDPQGLFLVATGFALQLHYIQEHGEKERTLSTLAWMR